MADEKNPFASDVRFSKGLKKKPFKNDIRSSILLNYLLKGKSNIKLLSSLKFNKEVFRFMAKYSKVLNFDLHNLFHIIKKLTNLPY